MQFLYQACASNPVKPFQYRAQVGGTASGGCDYSAWINEAYLRPTQHARRPMKIKEQTSQHVRLKRLGIKRYTFQCSTCLIVSCTQGVQSASMPSLVS